MQSLKIEVNFFKNQSHSIYIGNCEWLFFKNKRYVRDYLVRYKRMLIDNVRVINNLNIQIYTIYRHNYFQFSPRITRDLDNLFKEFIDDYNMIFKNYSTGNNNAFVLQRIQQCYNFNNNCLEILKRHSQRYKNYPLNEQVKTISKILTELQSKFNSDKRDLSLEGNQRNSKLIVLPNTDSESA
jgi:hypothetical protein